MVAALYDIRNWYWKVVDTLFTTHVYSSASSSFVVLADATYVAWLAAGNTPTTIPTLVELVQVLGLGTVVADTLGSNEINLTTGDQSLINPLPASIAVTSTVGGRALTFPVMNSPISTPRGRTIFVFNSGITTVRLKSSSGATILDLKAQWGTLLFLTDNSTADGAYSGTNISVLASNPIVQNIENMTSDRIVGRDTGGVGNAEELTVGGGIEFTGSGGLQTSAFTGDATKSAGGTALTIPNDTITFAKFQNISTDRLIGRDASGSGDATEISLSTGLEFSGSDSIRLADNTAVSVTPTITFDTPGDLSVVYSTRTMGYLKVGKIVIVTFLIVTSTFTFTTASGNFKITTASSAIPTVNSSFNSFFAGGIDFSGITTAYGQITPYAEAATTQIRLQGNTSPTTRQALSVADFTTGTNLVLQGTTFYFT